MKVLDEQPAGWFLLEDGDGRLYLDVNCSHGAFGYSVLIALDRQETAVFRASGRAYLDRLGDDISYSAPGARGSRSPYRTRDLTQTHGSSVSRAVQLWRALDGAS